MSGLYVRNGSNPPTGRSPHWFLGDGMVHGVRIEEGRAAWYRNRRVGTTMHTAGQEFAEAGVPGRDVNPSNVALAAHAGRLLTLGEVGWPYELAPDDLATVGPWDFDGWLTTAMTAHPKIDPDTGEMHFFGYGFVDPLLMVFHGLNAHRDGDDVVLQVHKLSSASTASTGSGCRPRREARLRSMSDSDASGQVRVVRIDQGHVRNAVNSATAQRLHDELLAFDADDGVRVAVLTGDEAAFSAGANLKDLPVLRDSGPLGPTRLQLGKPVIAAIEGWCVAGGMELAAWCDLRVAGDTARFGCLERRWGVPLIDGGTYRLPRIVGLGRALDLILTGREIDAAEAERLGFVDRRVPAGSALDAAVELATQIAASPWRAVVNDRTAVYEGLGLGLVEALANEDRLGRDTIFAEGFADGVARFTTSQQQRRG